MIISEFISGEVKKKSYKYTDSSMRVLANILQTNVVLGEPLCFGLKGKHHPSKEPRSISLVT